MTNYMHLILVLFFDMEDQKQIKVTKQEKNLLQWQGAVRLRIVFILLDLLLLFTTSYYLPFTLLFNIILLTIYIIFFILSFGIQCLHYIIYSDLSLTHLLVSIYSALINCVLVCVSAAFWQFAGD